MKKTFALVYVVLLAVSFVYAQQPNLSLPDLQKPVRVLVDAWGVPHIYAETEHDLFFAQGYQAASDRLFQFEMFRRRATGTMAEVFGPRELRRDIGARLFRFRGNMDEELSHYHPRGKAIISAFVEGINAYVKQVKDGKAPMPYELRMLGIAPGFWTPEVVVSRHNGLLMNVQRELSMARQLLAYGEAAVRDVHFFEPLQPILQMDSSIRPEWLADRRILELYNAFRLVPRFQQEDLPARELSVVHPSFIAEPGLSGSKNYEGSNNWVISGQRSASGFPLMGNDPHRVVAAPSLRYIVHLNGPGWNVIGGGEPTLPGVSIGHNEEGAWGLTIFETDAEDLYVYRLKPGDPSRYFHKGKWLRFSALRESIPLKGQAPVDVTLQYSVHGPVTFVDTTNGVAYAIRCAWLEKGGAPYLASLRMGQAKTWGAFREACTYSYIPAENMVWADRRGNIGWQAVGIAPIRKNHSGLVPVPGDGRYEWSGYQPIAERPSAFNPAQGFFSTANENNIPAGYPHMNSVGYTWAEPFRQQRIKQVLGADSQVTMDDMQQLQADWYSMPAAALIPLLTTIETTDSIVHRGKEILRSWDHILSPQSVAASIYVTWEALMEEKLLSLMGMRKTDDLTPSFNTLKMISLLQQPLNEFWTRRGLSRNSIMLSTLRDAMASLTLQLGQDTSRWHYGQEKMKHVRIPHPFSGLLNPVMAKDLDHGPWPRGGNGNTVSSTGDRLNQDFGASFRILVDCGDWDRAQAINSPGQSGDPSGKHYGDLFHLWKENRYFPLYFSKEKVEEASNSIRILVPK